MTRTRTTAACHESAARDMMEREWGQRDRDKALRFRLSRGQKDRSVIR